LSTNVEPEEAEAVLDGVAEMVRDAARVAARDFRRPQRLSAARLDALEAMLRKPLAALPAALQEASGTRLTLALGRVGEVSAEGLFDGAEDATILRFAVDGQPGWLRWDAGEVAALAEGMLGATDVRPEPRALTRLEERIVGEPLVALVASLADALGLSADGFAFAREPQEVGHWSDAEGAESYRLCVELDVGRPGAEPATAELYLPLPNAPEADERAAAADLPAHLAPVAVAVRCRLAQTEITLSQLLELEEGDVLATDVPVDEPAQLLLEERPFARAHLGTHRGRLAVRIAPAAESGEQPS